MENYFEVLELSIDDIQGKDEAAIQNDVKAAYMRLYARTIGPYVMVPRRDRRTQAQWQVILDAAKKTLLDPKSRAEHIAQQREAHIVGLTQKTGLTEVLPDADTRGGDNRTPPRKIVGINLGLTYSSIAHVNENGNPEIIPNASANRITPSVILFEDDIVTIGEIAKHHASVAPERVVEFVRREIGKSKKEYSREFNGREYSAEELSALILLKLKQDAEAYLNTEITDAVITVPAYFGDAQREATRNAGKIAGLNVLQVMNEPTAAAVAYGIDLDGGDQTAFVFALGDGTFDVTIMQVSGSEMQMIATNGDHRLGGKDWDDKIITYVAQTFEEEHGENPLQDLHTYQDIQLNAISAKEHLSTKQRIRVVCNYNGKSSRVEVTREKFEELTVYLVTRCSSLCNVVLSEAEMTWGDIDVVLLVGGSTRMPMVQEMITNISGKHINSKEVNPDEAVALGAAIQGTIRQIGKVPGRTPDTSVKKDVPSAVLHQFIGPAESPTETVTDGATHSLGLVAYNARGEAYVHVIIPRMTPVPCEVVVEFGTLEDDQSSLQIKLIQGLEQGQKEDDHIKFENHKLGECVFDLPPGLPKGSSIDVTYKYNLDQTLEVTAEGPDGRTASVTIDRPTLDETKVAEATGQLQNLEVE